MDYIPDFIDRKHGRKPIVYDIDIMEKYLKDTYGITVYQEQVMLLSRLLGGFTRGESDTLRKAMGKKIKSKLDELKPKFIKGGQANGHNPEVLEKIWADWEKFASYAFNKSHATCYSWVAYQTAYLKANYPSEYMAAVLSRNLADIKTITQYMTECKQMGIKVLGPDINESIVDFSSNRNGDIRFGLAAVKGVGEAAVKSIIDEREKNGPFKNIYDFVERVNFSVINRKCMENLAYAGGFDSIIDFHRSKFFAEDTRSAGGAMFIELLIRYGQRVQQEKQNSQQSLFGGGDVVDIQPPTVPVAEDWNQLQVLNKEREMIGLYLSSHPLDEYKVVIKHMCKAGLADLSDLEPFSGQELGLAGVVTSVQAMTTKTGRPWGKFTLEDYNGGVREFALFGKDYEQFRPMMYPNYFLFIKGKVQPRPYGDNPELEFKILSMTQLSQVRDELIKELHIVLPVEELTSSFAQEFSQMVQSNKGNTVLRLLLVNRAEGVTLNMFSKRYKVAMTSELVDYLDKNELKFTLS